MKRRERVGQVSLCFELEPDGAGEQGDVRLVGGPTVAQRVEWGATLGRRGNRL